jgi:DASH complex subunit DAD2
VKLTWRTRADLSTVKIPKPKDSEEETTEGKAQSEVPLPQTLVRIPTEQAALLPQSTSGSIAD